MRADARDAGGLLRPSRTSAPCWSSRSAASRSSRRRSPTARAGGTASRRRSSRSSRRAAPSARPRRACAHRAASSPARLAHAEREWCDVVGADAVAEVRRIGLHVGPGVEPDARPRRPIGSSSSAAARCSARSPRSWAPSTCSRRARRHPATATRADPDHHARRGGSAGARARHPRHAAVARQHPRRPDDDRGEVARRDAQGRRARAARGRRRLRRADPPQGADGDGHARARRRVGDRHGRRRRPGRRLHDRARHADRQSRSRR